jgi:site-specific DNA recombinase
MSTLAADAQPYEALRLIAVKATPMPTGLGVAEYYRVSDDREGGGLHVERQREDVQALRPAGQPGHPYVDNDITASGKRVRPAFEQLLADIEAGRVQTLLAWHPDRIYRTTSDLQRLVKACDAHAVEIRTSKHGDLDLGTASGRLVAGLLAEVATYELEHGRERMVAKHMELAKAGAPSGGRRLFGYTKGFAVDPDTGQRTIAVEADALQTVVANLIAGATLRSQAVWLNSQGLTGTQGGQWTNTNLKALVLRRSLTGVRVWHAGAHDEQTFPAIWPALVTAQQHQQLVALLTGPGHTAAPGHNTRRHLLTGVAQCCSEACCGGCGAGLAAATEAQRWGAQRGRYGIYRCREHFCVSRKQDRVDAITLELVGEWLAKQSPTGLLEDPKTSATMTRLANLAKEIDRKLKRVERDYDAEVLTGAEFRVRKDALAGELAAVEQERLRHQRPAHLLDPFLGQPDAHALLAALPLDRLRAVVAAVGTPVVHQGHRRLDDFSVVTMTWKHGA